MKKLNILIIFLFVSLFIFSEEKAQLIKKGEKASFSGVLIIQEEYEKMYDIMIIYQETQLLEKNLIIQVEKYKQLLELKNKEIDFLQKKYELEKNLRIDLALKLEKDQIKVKILSVTSSVGISVSLAQLVGLGVFSLLWYNMNK